MTRHATGHSFSSIAKVIALLAALRVGEKIKKHVIGHVIRLAKEELQEQESMEQQAIQLQACKGRVRGV